MKLFAFRKQAFPVMLLLLVIPVVSAALTGTAKAQQAFIEMLKVGDDELRSQGFKLSRDTEVSILCIGEGVDEMYDYGWIINADTREMVWLMKIEDTDHAGGAKKNRLAKKQISLKKGNYIAYYTSDGSHSHFEWNDDPPEDEDNWGLSIRTKNEADRGNASLFNEEDFKSADLIAEIVRVKDNDFLSKEFTIDQDTKIKIYAIGEGTRGGMADFGWIEEDSSGKTIWRMSYKKTDRAGGAAKNRKAVEVISLPKGKYRIYYETDPSHAYKDWNANPPDDQERYGITLMYDKSASIN